MIFCRGVADEMETRDAARARRAQKFWRHQMEMFWDAFFIGRVCVGKRTEEMMLPRIDTARNEKKEAKRNVTPELCVARRKTFERDLMGAGDEVVNVEAI